MAISVKETTSNKHRRDVAAVAARYLAMPRGSPDGVPERAHETLDRWLCYRGKKSAGMEKGPYVTDNLPPRRVL